MADRILKLGKSHIHQFNCPACGEFHSIDTHRWTFDGNYARPTLSPSILATGKRFSGVPDDDATDKSLWPEFVCHSFVRNGQIQFLNDCTHDLAGQTVDLPAVDQESNNG